MNGNPDDRSQVIQGALAGVVLVGLFSLVIMEVLLGKALVIPDVLSITATAVVAYVFGQRGVTTGFHAATNGIASLAQSQIIQPPPLAAGSTRTETSTTTAGSEPTTTGGPQG